MAQAGSVQLLLQSLLTKTFDLTVPQAQLPVNKLITLLNGTGANQADLAYWDTVNLAASGSTTLDLNGSLTDALGVAVNFLRIKLFYLFAYSTNANTVVIGNAAANQFVGWFGAAAHTEAVRPGGLSLHVAPDATAFSVTAGTGDQLKIANGGAGTAVDFDLVLIGASA